MTKKIHFYKYQGTGNDFVIIPEKLDLSTSQITKLCDRKYGIGADGVILMWPSEKDNTDFEMMYYNADGTESFCGNGSRCAVMHAQYLKWIDSSCYFISNDGPHLAEIKDDLVYLKMGDVSLIEKRNNDYFIHTGSPHYIQFLSDLENLEIVSEAHKIRYNDEFKLEGVNVNFLCHHNPIQIRTYERGVEDETLSCGTGATAAAIATYLNTNNAATKATYSLQTQGGNLSVQFEKQGDTFVNVYLIGPATYVFEGAVNL